MLIQRIKPKIFQINHDFSNIIDIKTLIQTSKLEKKENETFLFKENLE